MSESISCTNCQSPNAYLQGALMNCPECGNEWNADEVAEDTSIVKDINGVALAHGDMVVVMKDLPVKGFLKVIKSGTKVKNIRLTDGDHNIDCKIEGFGAMALKSEFVRKV